MKSTLLSMTLLFTVLGFSQNSNNMKLDSLFSLLSNKNIAMGNVAVFQDGKETYTKSFGYKDIEIREFGDTHTLYRVGSLSHIFTAAIIMQLIREDQLNLKTELAKFFPYLPQASKLSMAQLLKQCPISSSPNSAFQEKISKLKSRQEFLEYLKTKSHPDKHGFGSDLNYMLLSMIAEDLENRSLPDILQNRIIAPLNLKQARFADEIKPKKNEALPYFYEDGNWHTSRKTPVKTALGESGQFISSAQDIARFLSALFSGKLIDDHSMSAMISDSDNCGLGAVPSTFRDKTYYIVKGSVNNFRSIAAYFPEENTSVALTTNGSRIKVSSIFDAVLNIYYGYPYSLKSLGIN